MHVKRVNGFFAHLRLFLKTNTITSYSLLSHVSQLFKQMWIHITSCGHTLTGDIISALLVTSYCWVQSYGSLGVHVLVCVCLLNICVFGDSWSRFVCVFACMNAADRHEYPVSHPCWLSSPAPATCTRLFNCTSQCTATIFTIAVSLQVHACQERRDAIVWHMVTNTSGFVTKVQIQIQIQIHCKTLFFKRFFFLAVLSWNIIVFIFLYFQFYFNFT